MEQEKIIKMSGSITVNELADNLNLSVASLIQELFKNGIVATINQKLDYDTVSIIIDELGLKVKLEQVDQAHKLTERHQTSDKGLIRPPVVAAMGHVDHGKTTLLDKILSMKTVESEDGGITQHISAYQTEYDGRKITLLDTPGHEAFASIRQHGALLTDIVVIVVAADDGVKPQTVEAIKFAESANAKIIVAITKIDKPDANIEMVKTQLASEYRLNPEEWGGDTIFVPVSGKTGEGIDKLLESILLIADIEEFKADYDYLSEGLVIEARMQHGKGAMVGLLVQHGELKVGDVLVAGGSYGKIRTIADFSGKMVDKVGPSTPVTVTGFKTLPEFGELFKEVASEKEARTIANQARYEASMNIPTSNVTSLELLSKIHHNAVSQEFNVLVKADVQGSLTSVVDNLKLIDAGDEVQMKIVNSGIGDITENDVKMAAGDSTIIYGFDVNISASIRRLAARLGVQVRLYRVIYELLDDVRSEIEKKLSPEIKEQEIGKLTIKGVFRTSKDKIIAGGLVTAGKITPDLLVRVKRNKEQIAEMEVMSVEKNQQEAKEVFEGEMCGLSLKSAKKVQLEIGDKLEFFKREFIARKLK
ncbi:MAG: translation initiation factor IF-2 [Candidatus Saccharibacteria bacterium]|nr:translation initiation factor IF-2 [Candidatus Saccharibacteria bacterium]